MKIKEFLKRDVCRECDYYHKENGTCQSKKCATGGDGTVGFIERKFCTPYKATRHFEFCGIVEKDEMKGDKE